MTLYRKSIGQQGEQQAASYLRSHGFQIIEINYMTRLGEIDIIARRGDKLHFVEVKTRRNTAKGYPYEAVNYRKVQHLKRAIAAYLKAKHIKNTKLSLDVISILLDTGAIKHYSGVDIERA